MAPKNLVWLEYDAIMRDASLGGCFTRDASLSSAAHIHRGTLGKIKRREPVRVSTARQFEKAINDARKPLGLPEVIWKSWVIDQPSEYRYEREKRTARGWWHVVARDLVVPPQDPFRGLTYDNGPRILEMDLHVKQNGPNVWADGIDCDGDKVKAWKGEFSEDWWYISGRHAIRHDRGHLEGVFFLKFLQRGDHMSGAYLQNETDHQSGIVFGSLELTLVEPSPPPAG